MGNLKKIGSKEELEEAIHGVTPIVVVHFSESQCEASRQIDQVFSQLATDFPHALFLRVDFEGKHEISEAYKVSKVPYFLFYKDGKIVETLRDANPSSLANKIASLAGPTNLAGPAAPASLGMAAGATVIEKVQEMSKEPGSSSDHQNPTPGLSSDLAGRVKQLIDSHRIFLFMEGSPDLPKCQSSKTVIDVLHKEGVAFGSFDVVADNKIREAVKLYSNWPAYPQLYCHGSLIGGNDIVVALHKNGELSSVFRDHGFDGGSSTTGVADSVTGLSKKLMSHLKDLVNAKPVMVFMEGKNDEPNGYSENSVIRILREERSPFEIFDVLLDEEVREGLKVLSNWSSYPQVYVKGEFIGGFDIVSEMHKSGELTRLLSEKQIIMLN
ncbi:Monothiol glutaredoxin-S17 protein [Rhynchospora pubera]|uniref:Monothiol glutaredoxin-S17 protein n=1 Tax=Rhynchospora pubera TaxID=906938 RepID=A0AAV8HB01_9POAL|nr:Monothiol glutaredoxin-S17 protein [Rhynchospora pubera]